MNFRRFESMTRALADGQTQRREFLQSLTGLTLVGGIAPRILAADAEDKVSSSSMGPVAWRSMAPGFP